MQSDPGRRELVAGEERKEGGRPYSSAAMRVAYLLLLLLHLSASTCDATSRNHRVFLHPGRADVVVGATSPAAVIHGHRRMLAKDLFYDAHYPYRVMGATPAPPLPGVEDPRRQPDKEIITAATTMAPSSSPQVDDNGRYFVEPGGEDVSGGDGEGGPPPPVATATAHEEESSVGENIRFDYVEPNEHPPSHN